MTVSRMPLVLFMAALLGAVGAARVVGDEALIEVQRGTLPIVISAPHGGRVDIPGIEEKEHGTKVRDQHTAEIAEMVAQYLYEALDAKPYYVIAEFSREYADPNRGPGHNFEEAYSSPEAGFHYDAYHAALREYVDEIREDHGEGLLIDIHGQSSRSDSIFRGTADGRTVLHMLETYGIQALIGSNSVFGQLEARGYLVDPVLDPDSAPDDEVRFNGGYIVRAYGSQHEDGIDAIQIEIGMDYRRGAATRRQTARDLARSVAAYLETYPLAPQVPEPGSLTLVSAGGFILLTRRRR